jgi:hypothetical protein
MDFNFLKKGKKKRDGNMPEPAPFKDKAIPLTLLVDLVDSPDTWYMTFMDWMYWLSNKLEDFNDYIPYRRFRSY